jgi:hypothetical protein
MIRAAASIALISRLARPTAEGGIVAGVLPPRSIMARPGTRDGSSRRSACRFQFTAFSKRCLSGKRRMQGLCAKLGGSLPHLPDVHSVDAGSLRLRVRRHTCNAVHRQNSIILPSRPRRPDRSPQPGPPRRLLHYFSNRRAAGCSQSGEVAVIGPAQGITRQ